MVRSFVASFISVFSLSGLLVFPEQGGVTPKTCLIDEAPRDKDLVEFRDRLRGAVRARDLNRLRPFVHPDFGFEAQNRGREKYFQAHELTDPKSPEWLSLEMDLAGGGHLNRPDSFCAPHYACPTPIGVNERVHVILGVDVAARDRPSPDGRILARLSCDVLRIPNEGIPPRPDSPVGWNSVWLSSGTWAFIPARDAVEPARWLEIGRIGGKWWLTGRGSID